MVAVSSVDTLNTQNNTPLDTCPKSPLFMDSENPLMCARTVRKSHSFYGLQKLLFIVYENPVISDRLARARTVP